MRVEVGTVILPPSSTKRTAPLSFQRGNDDNVCRRYDATDDYGDGMAPLGSLPLSRLSSLVPSPLVPRQPSQSYPLLLLYRAGLSNLSMHLAPPSSGTVEPLTDVRRLAPLSFRFALYHILSEASERAGVFSLSGVAIISLFIRKSLLKAE